MKKSAILYLLIVINFLNQCSGGGKTPSSPEKEKIIVGAARTGAYLPLLRGKRIAVLANHSSLIGKVHLVDTLLRSGIRVVKVFAPEHGFRGDRPDGALIRDSKDVATGLPVVSLYGQNKRLPATLLEDIDILIFDIQDVGVRFYTYISAMHYAMEACAKAGKLLLVLDRPNPNGMYVAGPVLDSTMRSYVGMHPIPVVHGLTVGELATMINGEGWLLHGRCPLKVIGALHYDHSMTWPLPVKPSPNLPNDLAVRLYPSLALFEGTAISVGRGTYSPFLQIGHPSFNHLPHRFRPVAIEGMSKYPPHENTICYGYDLAGEELAPHFTLRYLLEFYHTFEHKEAFFNDYFNKLTGDTTTMRQIKDGLSEADITAGWEKDLARYKQIRKKYLLYPDFE